MRYHMRVPEERTTRHSHYNLNYPKHRGQVFRGEVRERLMRIESQRNYQDADA